jgi:hypothetical protein
MLAYEMLDLKGVKTGTIPVLSERAKSHWQFLVLGCHVSVSPASGDLQRDPLFGSRSNIFHIAPFNLQITF